MKEVSGRWIFAQEDRYLSGDLVGQPIHWSAQRSDRPAVADPRATAAPRQTAGPTAEVDPPPTAQRHPLANPGRRPVARRPRTLRALAVDLRAVPALATRPGVAADRGETAGPRRRRWSDLLDGVGGLHHQPGPPARCRRPPRPRHPGRATRARAGRSRVGPVPRRLDHQAAPGLRAGPQTAVAGVDRGPPWGQPAIHGRARRDPRRAV